MRIEVLTLPLSHDFTLGLNGALITFFSQSGVVVHDRLDESFLEVSTAYQQAVDFTIDYFAYLCG